MTFARPKRGDAGFNGKPGCHPRRAKSSRGPIPSLSPARSRHAAGAAARDLAYARRTSSSVRRRSSRTSIHNVVRVPRGSDLRRLLLFVFLLNWRTTFISLTAIHLSVLHVRRPPEDGPVDQHDDTRRPGHRHRRARRRRGRQRREHLRRLGGNERHGRADERHRGHRLAGRKCARASSTPP